MALNEGKYTGEFLLSEANGTRSREQVTIAAAAAALAAGTVVGRITASGKYAAYSNAASDGTQTAAGVLLYNVADSASDQKAVIIARDAEVQGSVLTGNDSAGTTDLAGIGIIVR